MCMCGVAMNMRMWVLLKGWRSQTPWSCSGGLLGGPHGNDQQGVLTTESSPAPFSLSSLRFFETERNGLRFPSVAVVKHDQKQHE